MPNGVFSNDDCPLAEDVEKQLIVPFVIMKVAHDFIFFQAPTDEFFDAHC